MIYKKMDKIEITPYKEHKLSLKSVNNLKRRGIYFLFNNQELVYIGQSDNILLRINTHIEESTKVFNSYDYIEYNEEDIQEIEKQLIIKYKPRFNIIHNNEIIVKKGQTISETALRRILAKIIDFKTATVTIEKLNKKKHLSNCTHWTAIAVKKSFGHYNKKKCHYTEKRYIIAVKEYLKQFPTFDE